MDAIEIIVVSADEAISQAFNPVEFVRTFNVDWKTEEFCVAIKSQVASADQAPARRTYRKCPDQIRHRRYYNYDGIECWASVRVVTFKEVI
jgi:hypothetical protein